MSNHNLSNAQDHQWNATIYGMEEVTFKIRTLVIPGMSCSSDKKGSKTKFKLPIQGGLVEFDNMSFTCLLDSDFANYKLMTKWLLDNADADENITKDVGIILLSPTGQLQNVSIKVEDAFPVSIGEIALNAYGEETDLVFTFDLEFTSWDFEPEVVDI